MVLFDPFVRLDAMQAGYVARMPNVSLMKVSLSRRFPLERLRAAGTLSKAMELLFAPELDLHAIKAIMKLARWAGGRQEMVNRVCRELGIQ